MVNAAYWFKSEVLPNKSVFKWILAGLAILLTSPVSLNAAVSLVEKLHLQGNFIQGGLIRGSTSPQNKLLLNSKPLFINDKGYFAFGFSRDADAPAKLVLIDTKGKRREQIFQVRKRHYNIQRINGLPQDKVTPRTAEQLAHIQRDFKKVATAREIHSQYQGFMQSFIWPAAGIITGVYGSQRILNGESRRPHFGLDIAAKVGSTVIAPAEGRVVVADENMFFSGGTLLIDHGGGIFSSFLHLSKINVRLNQWVHQGQKIAEMGATGRVTGPHLDWRINWFGVRLDPAFLVSEKPPKKLKLFEK